MEVLLPLLAILNLSTNIWTASDASLLKFYFDTGQYKHACYPISYLDTNYDTWNSSWLYTVKQQKQMTPFFNYTNFLNTRLQDNSFVYKPEFDWFGPYNFLPPHCYEPLTEPEKFALPIIGYIERNNSLQDDLIDQLSLIFMDQGKVLPLTQSMFDTGIADMFNITLEDAQYLGDLYGFDASTWSWTQNNLMGNFTFKPFKDHEEFDEYVRDTDYGSAKHPGVCFGFDIHENSPNDYDLELMFQDKEPEYLKGMDNQQSDPFDPMWPDPRVPAYQYYSLHGFSYVQNWFANTLLRRKTGVGDASINLMTVPMGSNPMVVSKTFRIMREVYSYYMLLFFLPLFFRMIYRILVEKSTRVKEMMRMMGMTDLAYWGSWLIYLCLVNAMITLVLAPCLTLAVFPKSDPIIVIFWFWLFGQSLGPWLLFLQTWFDSPKQGAIWLSVLYFCTGLLTILLTQDHVRRSVKMTAAFILPPLAMTLGSEALIRQEFVMDGLHTDTLDLPHMNFSMHDSLVLMTTSSLFYTILGLWADRVVPSQYGERKSLFFCLEICCCGSKRARTSRTSARGGRRESAEEFETQYLSKENYESVPPEIAALESEDLLLKIEGLRKTYPNKFTAVDGMNINVYADQIFVLLGHNGAGKSTTIGVLSGLFDATEGRASILGVDLLRDRFEARKFMGICPQYDVQFELLTPGEHIQFFQSLKGSTKDSGQLRAEADSLIKDIGLADKRNAMAYTLSGGNRRKLSTIMALCGQSRFVIFDEPTAGMDLTARRHFWNMLRKYRKGRIILMSTHYMDEADILGDRIGIMAGGKLTCLGSGSFLKRKFGVGYNFTAVKSSPENNTLLMPFMKHHLGPNCARQSEIQNEMTCKIPGLYAPKFSSFFEQLDKELLALGLRSYGISQTTLEEVFMKVGHLPDPTSKPSSSEEQPSQPVLTQVQASDQDSFSIKNDHSDEFEIEADEESNEESNEESGEWINEGCDDALLEEDAVMDGQGETLLEVKVRKRRSSRRKKSRRQDLDKGLVHDENDSELQTSLLPENQSQAEVRQIQHQRFNLRDNADDLDSSLVRNLGAQFYRRWCTYRNSPLTLFMDFINANVFVCVALCIKFGHMTFTRNSSRTYSSDMVPSNTPFLFSPETIDNESSDLNASTIFANFSGLNRFDFAPVNNWPNAMESFDQFAQEINDFGNFSNVIPPYQYSSYGLFEANSVSQQYSFVNWINLTSIAAAPLFPQLMYESILRVATNDSDFRFTVTNTPYPVLYMRAEESRELDINIAVFSMGVAFAIVLLNIVGQLVSEKASGLTHLQVVSGLQLRAFWVSQFIVDYLKCALLVGTILLAFRVLPGFEFYQFWRVALVWPFGALPFTYVTSSFFTNVGNAQIFTMGFSFLCLSILVMSTFAQRAWFESEVTGDYLMWLYRLTPYFPLGQALFMEALAEKLKEFRDSDFPGKGQGVPIDTNLWSLQNFYGDLLGIGFSAILWTTVLILIETKACQKKQPANAVGSAQDFNNRTGHRPDKDVLAESKRVEKDPWSDVLVRQLTKEYKVSGGAYGCSRERFRAVNDLSFALKSGESFALLGVNGAGKTTTFRALTHEVIPTAGEIFIGSHDLNSNFEEARKLIGYCPQANLIFPNLTVEQQICYFAKIKGIPEKFIDTLCKDVIVQLGLNVHRKKLAGALSGGNQRKLCVAIAIVGNPPVILLDEPSAGMDPGARRFMWQVVGDIAKSKTSAVVLTTHSMEEAEALCTKLAIMVKGGVFKCFGPAQHIRSKYGTGYLLELKIRYLPYGELDVAEKKFYKQPDKDLINLTQESQFLNEELQNEIVETAEHIDSREDRLRYLHAQVNVYGAIFKLCDVFREVELIEQFSTFVRVRVSKREKSIGQVFELIDSFRESYDLAEYAVSQTTLEQIFQSFADEDFDENIRIFNIRDGGRLAEKLVT